ncbi:hypothetical protein HOF92_11865 [bacterium]|nr:hypothetical protein [bacterium]
MACKSGGLLLAIARRVKEKGTSVPFCSIPEVFLGKSVATICRTRFPLRARS